MSHFTLSSAEGSAAERAEQQVHPACTELRRGVYRDRNRTELSRAAYQHAGVNPARHPLSTVNCQLLTGLSASACPEHGQGSLLASPPSARPTHCRTECCKSLKIQRNGRLWPGFFPRWSPIPSHLSPVLAGFLPRPSPVPRHLPPVLAGFLAQLPPIPSHLSPVLAGFLPQLSPTPSHLSPVLAGFLPQLSPIPSHLSPVLVGFFPQLSPIPSHLPPVLAGFLSQLSPIPSHLPPAFLNRNTPEVKEGQPHENKEPARLYIATKNQSF